MWLEYVLAGQDTIHWSTASALYALAAGAVVGLGYAAWNIGISQGSMAILAGASYFIPIFSSLISALLLHAPLGWAFWQGAAMVYAGSVVCWLATKRSSESKNKH
ncbi:EamA family transporter [Neisseria perflava]|uniref:EamA family transporter n=1 Tax=Neisseria perflava TaxID=33053 RepID=UPI00209D94B7|nr:EamA family transporter [Neisseria perflava]MCP1660834.1 drug/metabolite transporter (DMT)-like permease [Neisseria perflava]MCP1773481.1 drug/metabolite transporter (DMT)-like permease [Neisseria perflava]